MNFKIIKLSLEEPNKFIAALLVSLFLAIIPLVFSANLGGSGIWGMLIPLGIFFIFNYSMVKRENNSSFKSGLKIGLIIGLIFYLYLFLYSIVWDQFLYKFF